MHTGRAPANEPVIAHSSTARRKRGFLGNRLNFSKPFIIACGKSRTGNGKISPRETAVCNTTLFPAMRDWPWYFPVLSVIGAPSLSSFWRENMMLLVPAAETAKYEKSAGEAAGICLAILPRPKAREQDVTTARR